MAFLFNSERAGANCLRDAGRLRPNAECSRLRPVARTEGRIGLERTPIIYAFGA